MISARMKSGSEEGERWEGMGEVELAADGELAREADVEERVEVVEGRLPLDLAEVGFDLEGFVDLVFGLVAVEVGAWRLGPGAILDGRLRFQCSK